jgi:hypothetical protein
VFTPPESPQENSPESKKPEVRSLNFGLFLFSVEIVIGHRQGGFKTGENCGVCK